jgi:hypothetical protein
LQLGGSQFGAAQVCRGKICPCQDGAVEIEPTEICAAETLDRQLDGFRVLEFDADHVFTRELTTTIRSWKVAN